MKRYEVKCLKCKKSAFVNIGADHRIDFEGGVQTNLLAGRYRADSEFGWECTCGNDNRISKQESKQMDQLVKGTPQQIADIVKTLSIPDSKQFQMVGA